MKKKILYGIISFALILFSLFVYSKSLPKENKDKMAVYEVELQLNCKAAYLMEQTTGKVLYSLNEEEPLAPASMTKMMGLILICEKLVKNEITLQDKVIVSSEAASMGGSQVFLQPYEEMSVNDLLKCVCICSANDAIYALSEYVGISNENFIKMMNEKAKELHCTHTQFQNVTGFDDINHYSCAKDMGLIAQELLKYEEIILPFTSTYDSYIREDSKSPFWLVNTNKMIRYYEGMDGLKTGYTNKSGFCLTSTAKRNQTRLISVVMNAPSKEIRTTATSKLLDYGFSKVKTYKLYNQGDLITTIEVDKAKKQSIAIYATKPFYFVTFETVDPKNIQKEIILDTTLSAPLKSNSKVGTLKVTIDQVSYEYELLVSEDVEALEMGELIQEYFIKMIA